MYIFVRWKFHHLQNIQRNSQVKSSLRKENLILFQVTMLKPFFHFPTLLTIKMRSIESSRFFWPIQQNLYMFWRLVSISLRRGLYLHVCQITKIHHQLRTLAYFIRYLLESVLCPLSFQQSFKIFIQVLVRLKIRRRSLHFSQQLKFQLRYNS